MVRLTSPHAEFTQEMRNNEVLDFLVQGYKKVRGPIPERKELECDLLNLMLEGYSEQIPWRAFRKTNTVC